MECHRSARRPSADTALPQRRWSPPWRAPFHIEEIAPCATAAIPPDRGPVGPVPWQAAADGWPHSAASGMFIAVYGGLAETGLRYAFDIYRLTD